MPRFELVTLIAAPQAVCFDVARDLDLHVVSMARHGERAIAGRTTGRIEGGEEVTCEARSHSAQRQPVPSQSSTTGAFVGR